MGVTAGATCGDNLFSGMVTDPCLRCAPCTLFLKKLATLTCLRKGVAECPAPSLRPDLSIPQRRWPRSIMKGRPDAAGCLCFHHRLAGAAGPAHPALLVACHQIDGAGTQGTWQHFSAGAQDTWGSSHAFSLDRSQRHDGLSGNRPTSRRHARFSKDRDGKGCGISCK